MYQITFFSSPVEQLFHRSCYLFLSLCPSWAPSEYSLTYGAWQERAQKTRPRFQWEVSIHTLFLFWGLPEQPNSNNRTKVALDWCKSHCLFIRIRVSCHIFQVLSFLSCTIHSDLKTTDDPFRNVFQVRSQLIHLPYRFTYFFSYIRLTKEYV